MKAQGSHKRNKALPKVGIVSEGDSEVVSLGFLFEQLCARTGRTFLKPLLADVDPKAEIPVIARGLAERIRLAMARGASIVVVLLDLENLQECAPQRAQALQNAIRKVVQCDVLVVIKDCKFENWLIAAPSALEAQPGRFPRAAKIRAAASPNKADNISDAEDLLKGVISRRDYDKTQDAMRILRLADVTEMAGNSRSFRRFLAVLGDFSYKNGSRRP